jgi:hypothetical protein
MRNLIALAAVFLAVFAVNANAGDLTVANTDLTLAGGITASYNYMSDAKAPIGTKKNQDNDYFNVDTAIVHLFKNPTVDSPVGGHFAFGSFDVKVVDRGETILPTIAGENFRVWLGYFSWMPVENLTIDAGLLWHKFGEAPITILNPHVTRPVAFTAQPVCFGGARIGYDAGIVKVYAGMNDGSYLGPGHGNKDSQVDAAGNVLESDRAFDVGVSVTPAEMLKIAVNYFDHDEGYDTVNGSVGVDLGMFSAKVEANFVKADTKNRVAAGVEAKDDSATTWALYAGVKLTDNFKIPIRYELVDDSDNSGIYGNKDGWNLTITPTFNPTKNSFVRLEGVYAKDDNKIFRDSDGVGGKEDTRTSVIAEFGFLL